jgi:hypothetical protein
MHMTATLTKWYEEHGRHEIFAGGKRVALASTDHNLVLKDDIITDEEQHDLDALGIAKNTREEKRRARANRDEETRRMMKLYRELVLKEQPAPDLVNISLAAAGTSPKE